MSILDTRVGLGGGVGGASVVVTTGLVGRAISCGLPVYDSNALGGRGVTEFSTSSVTTAATSGSLIGRGAEGVTTVTVPGFGDKLNDVPRLAPDLEG